MKATTNWSYSDCKHWLRTDQFLDYLRRTYVYKNDSLPRQPVASSGSETAVNMLKRSIDDRKFLSLVRCERDRRVMAGGSAASSTATRVF